MMKRFCRLLPAVWAGTWLCAFGLSAATLDPAEFIPADVGSPTVPGSTRVEGAIVRIEGAGTGIGLRADQFHWASVVLTNDFDLKVRVAGLDNTDALARAGLMVRESEEPGAPFAATLTSPSAAGSHFLSRTGTGVLAQQAGFFPPNLPFAWLRLQRTGNLFTGFAGYDGQSWTTLGSTTLNLTNARVGFAVTSRDASAVTRALFTDLADVGEADRVASFAQRIEPPGPTSRRSAIIISEVMYHPADRPDGRNGEFLELYNSQPYFEDLSGWRISGAYEYTLPPNTILPGGGFLLIAPNPSHITAIYGLTNVVGGFAQALPNSSGEVKLLSERGAVYFELEYRDKFPWPVAADGSGHSLALVRPSYGEADPRAWAASTRPGGSPGAWEFADASPRRQVVLNELMARAGAAGPPPFVELFNRGRQAVDLAGCRLGYDRLNPSYVFPPGTTLAAGGFLHLTTAELRFPLRADAETIFLRSPVGASDGGAVIDAVRFEVTAPGVSHGRSADGTDEYYTLSAPTPGASNAPPQPADIVFNELMYNPLSDDNDHEFIELHNVSGNPVNLTGWRITGGVEFNFPAGTQIPAGGYLVVAGNATRLRSIYPNLSAANCVGDFQGNLSGSGERLVLERPEVITDNAGPRTTFAPVDEVDYRTGGQWGYWADGGGSSLELVDPRANRRFGANWADSDESRRGRWTTIEHTGVLDLGGGTPDSLHVGLLGEGECLIDNVEVIGSAGTNAVINGDLEGDTPGFTAQGTHIRSSLETTEGDGSSRSLHIRASNNLDTGANRVRFRFQRPLTDGDTVTLRARVRWLAGWPEVLLRVRGNWLEATGRLDVPEGGGTPGARNSRAVDNAPPALTDVRHEPVLPAPGEPVVVSIRADDPDGLADLTLNWRVDPLTEYTALPLRDDGSGGDVRAGDGVFSATIPGQLSGVVVAFWIQATDAARSPATGNFPAGAPHRECLIRFGEAAAANAFGTYRIWLTRRGTTTWSNRPNLSNEPVDGTLVYGNFRAIHGAGFRFAGSPYHQDFASPTSDCHYVWNLPGDDLLLGTDSFNKVHGPGNGSFDDDTTQREQTVYWMARQFGLPWLYRRYVNVYVNGSKRRKLMEDTQVGSGDFIRSYYPDDPDGDLRKINPWFEFTGETAQRLDFQNRSWADLNDYRTSGGERKMARYRWNWQPRAANGTVNDYRHFYALIDAANTFGDDAVFTQALEREADMDMWLKTFALNHAVGNWDSFGHRNAQNMYAYRPERGRWQLIMWDANIVFGNSGSSGPNGDNLFEYNLSDGPMGRIYSTPKYRRAYYRFLREIADGPMETNRLNTLLDARYAAFQAAGVSASSPNPIKTWVRTRIAYLRSVVGQVSASFSARAEDVTGGARPVNWVTLSGSAPLTVHTVRVNGVEVPVRWTSDTTWAVETLLNPGNNQIRVEALDGRGEVIAGTTRQISVRFTGSAERPGDRLVFNEIHYRPTIPGAGFVELLNASSTHAFDLSGWRIDGLGYTFPTGTLLYPGQPWVVAADSGIFRSTYDPLRAWADGQFGGTLSPDGETLRLIQPGLTPDAETVVTAVTYSPDPPWPVAAAGAGSSLQLIDASRSEDERVGNWGIVAPRDPNALDWKFVQATGTAGTNGSVQLYLSSFPPVTDLLDFPGRYWGAITFEGSPFPSGIRLQREQGTLLADFLFDESDPDQSFPLTAVSQNGLDLRFQFSADERFVGRLAADGSRITGNYLSSGFRVPFVFHRLNPGGEVILDDLMLVAGNVAGAGPNLLQNGGFEEPLPGSWTATGGHSASEIIGQPVHAGTGALRLRSPVGGTGSDTNALIQTVADLTPGQVVTLSFWYLSSTNGGGVVARLGEGALEAAAPLDPPKDPHDEYTPGYSNTTAAILPAFPDVWINEVLPYPEVGTPWVELYNAGTNTLDLGGLFLSDSLENLQRDAFPDGWLLAPGQFLLVTLDGTGALDNPLHPRTSFRPSAGQGALYLSRRAGVEIQIVDFLRWNELPRGRSTGHHPDASPHDDREFATPTPAAPNSLVAPLLPIVINEWMALNNRIADPSGPPNDPEYDDWFELFNPNPVPISLAGYILSNAPEDRTKFVIPPGYRIPARGYLLVWADNQSRQNSPSVPDLHVNFRLSGDGEAIALFTPDGTLEDVVLFGRQQSNVSEGRATDGSSGAFVRFTTPSPGSSNGAPTVPAIPVVGLPVFDALGQLVLTWSSENGRRYQVFFQDHLADPWQALAAPLTAGGALLSLPDPHPSPDGRFYQVRVVE